MCYICVIEKQLKNNKMENTKHNLSGLKIFYPEQCPNTVIVKSDTEIIYIADKTDQSIKNSKLIASSAELLSNLIRLIDRLEENEMGNMSAVKRAKEAIKKATE